jgi:hypothetical protein
MSDAIPTSTRPPVALLPTVLASVFACVVGGVLGQVGNLIYASLGDVGMCIAVPGAVLLFLITGAISFFSTRLLSKWMKKPPG